MSSSEMSHIRTPGPDYGSQALTVPAERNGETVNGPAIKNRLERSLTFHQISYEVFMNCGRKSKRILDDCRYTAMQAIYHYADGIFLYPTAVSCVLD